jgi:xylan 1,4-beta-xylosidase
MQKVQVRVDAGKWLGALDHTWNYVGYDECNYTHTPGGMELIEKFGKLEKPYYMRAHHLLCTGILHPFYKWGSTNAYLEDEHGNPVYNFDLIDRMMDIYLVNNCKPFFEIGFMPRDLADPREAENKKNYKAHGQLSEYQRIGWAMPPKDYQKWYDLIYALVAHLTERYGVREVEQWYFEMWNEPDIFYWRGTPEEFNKLYDYTQAAVHAACPTARFGGPATTGTTDPNGNATRFLDGFLRHVTQGVNYVTGEKGTRIDYITFHTKGGGYTFDTVMKKQIPSVQVLVENVRTQCAVIEKYGLSHLEVVLSEADPDGWAAGGMYDNFNLNFRNTEYYASYVASSYKNLYDLAEELQMDIRPLAWAFMFEGERCFEGTRAFTTQGIDKAVFNLFKLYAKLGAQRLALDSSRDLDVCKFKDINGTEEGPEIDGWATQTGADSVEVLVYCHHDDWDVKNTYDVAFEISNLPFEGPAQVRHYRIDSAHSNAYGEWVRQGRPHWPKDGQYAAIKARDGLELYGPDEKLPVTDGRLNARFELPTHAISLMVVTRA